MKNQGRFALGMAVVALCLMAPPSTFAQDNQTVNVPLSSPGEPVRLEAGLLSGSIKVEVHDNPGEVIVEIVPEQRAEESGGSRDDGMKRITNRSLNVTIEERDNVVTVQGSWQSNVHELIVHVPRRTSAHLHSTNNGVLVVKGIQGDHELQNTNGPITATGVSGSVLAQTTNGEIRVTFDSIDRDKPMSFITFNGDVDVTLPKGLNADMRVSAGQGEILTDFDFQILPQDPKVENDRRGGRYRVNVERDVVARVGRGGSEMQFKTWNGSIYIRAK